MKILLLGANGYLGARLFVDLRDNFDVVGTYNHKQFFKDFIHLDVTSNDQVEQVFQKHKPDIVIQTANHASPRPAADDPEGYVKLNLDSTQIIKDAADKIGAKVIFISSFAALNPDNIYGQLKLQSEEIIQKTKAGYLILRPSLILGMSPNTENDRPFNRILRYLDEGVVCEFDTSWQFQPTYVGHLSEIIIKAIVNDTFNHLVHVFCTAVETQYSTAKDILKPFGISVKPTDKGMKLPVQERIESELKDLSLPICSYQEMVDKIHGEIKSRERFNL